jgi:hypothetical protein
MPLGSLSGGKDWFPGERERRRRKRVSNLRGGGVEKENERAWWPRGEEKEGGHVGGIRRNDLTYA